MKMKFGALFPLVMIGLALIFQSGPAEAYLDPGAGGIILQLLLGGVAGGLVVMKMYWARIKDWVSPRANPADPGPEDRKGPRDG